MKKLTVKFQRTPDDRLTVGIRRREALEAIEAVNDAASQWRVFAREADCSKKTIQKIAAAIKLI